MVFQVVFKLSSQGQKKDNYRGQFEG